MTGNGGNYRHDSYPIAFNVKVHGSCDTAAVIAKLAEEIRSRRSSHATWDGQRPIQWDDDREWYWAVEQHAAASQR